MGRKKNSRNISFRPLYKKYSPEDIGYMGVVTLLAEEMEAIYLMDVLGMYQEEASVKIGGI
jgi:predicted DNA-binding protein (UPF0251 family)